MLRHRRKGVPGPVEGFLKQGGGGVAGGQPRPVHGPASPAGGQGKGLSTGEAGGGAPPPWPRQRPHPGASRGERNRFKRAKRVEPV